jgi:hypothetical protein
VECLAAQLPPGTLEELFETNHLALLPSPIGDLVVLGSAGRRAVGLSASYRSPSEAGAAQFVRRRVREGLEARGWRYLESPRRYLLAFLKPDGRKAYLVVRRGGYSTRSVHRLLRAYGGLMIREGSSLMVVCRSPQRLQDKIGRAGDLVEVQHLDDFWKG